MLCDGVQVQFQVGLVVNGGGMRAVNIVSSHAFLRGNVESIKGQGQVDLYTIWNWNHVKHYGMCSEGHNIIRVCTCV